MTTGTGSVIMLCPHKKNVFSYIFSHLLLICKLLEPSGPVQASNGIALHFFYKIRQTAVPTLLDRWQQVQVLS